MTGFAKTIEHIKVLKAAWCTPFPEYVDLSILCAKAQDDQGEPGWYFCLEALIAWCGEASDG